MVKASATELEVDLRPCFSLRRRALLGGAMAVLTTQTACAPPSATTSPVSDEEPSSRASQPVEAASEATQDSGETQARVLLAYFSRPGENYYHGDRIDLDVGNTEVVARLIADRIGCDVHRIEAAEPYSDDYDDTVARNVREQNDDVRPAIVDELPSLDSYDIVMLASPLWNVRPPMIMQTFAEAHDFTGKTVHPITTFAVSGLGRAEGDYTAACPGAQILEALAVLGEDVTDSPSKVSSVVDAWLGRVGLLKSAGPTEQGSN